MATLAVTSNGVAYRHLPLAQQRKKHIVDIAVQQDSLVYVHLDPILQVQPDIIDIVMNTEPTLLFENPILHNDSTIIEQVLRRDGHALCQVAHPSLQMELIAVAVPRSRSNNKKQDPRDL